MSARGSRRQLPRWRALALLFFAVALGIAGCGGTSVKSQLQARLLAQGDLPTGWRASPTADSGQVSDAPCLASLTKQITGVTYERAGFSIGSGIPSTGEALATGPNALSDWRRAASALGRCHTMQLKFGKRDVTARIRPLSFPHVGDTSSAYAWSFTLSGIRVSFDVVLFTVGRYGGELVYIDLGPPPRNAVLAFTRAAVAKARTGATARVPNSVSILSAPVQRATTSDGTVGYRMIGTGPPLVLIMGYGGTMETWDPRFVDALAEHHRVVIFDNAGIGQTSSLTKPPTVDGMANQTSALISALQLKRPDVLGWSMGSMIAQALAVLHPGQVGHLVLCASYPGNGTTVKPTQAAIDALSSPDPQTRQDDLFPRDQAPAGQMFSAALAGYPSSAPAPAAAVAAQAQAVKGWWDGSDAAGLRAGSISSPTLIADGAEDRLDPVVNSHRLSHEIPGSKLKLYPDAGHAFLFQEAISFIPVIDGFLAS